jgi:hypothetical protein
MPRMARELLLILIGMGIGLGLLYLSSLVMYDPKGCGGCRATGLPSFWAINATGFGGMLVNWNVVIVDLMFWIVVSLAVVEFLSHLVVPLVKSGLDIIQ